MPDVVMPRLSDSMEEGTILKWLKAEGDEVVRGDELVEIETDKATMTYEADAPGTLAIVAQEGATLPIGRVVGLFPADEQDTVRERLADNLQAAVSLRLLMRADAAGLIPAVEVLLATSTVREAIREGGSRVQELKNYMETAGADLGMNSFDQYLYLLHETKRISLDTALGNATHRADLERRILIETGGRGA